MTMHTKRLYISGPMTGYPRKNFPAFWRAKTVLLNAGYVIISPADLDVFAPEDTWEECLRRDIKSEMLCEGIATLPGWKKSKGAQLEVYIAKALKWPVHSVSYWLHRRCSNSVH